MGDDFHASYSLNPFVILSTVWVIDMVLHNEAVLNQWETKRARCFQGKEKEQTRNEDCESVKRVKQPAKSKKMSDAEILAALREFLLH